MNISELKDDFMLEAVELLDEAEEALLGMDNGESFSDCYNKLFRAFHSLKGASGMFGLDELQAHMHQLETLLDKVTDSLSKPHIDYFLSGVDCARDYFKTDKIIFDYIDDLESNVEKKQSHKVATQRKKERDYSSEASKSFKKEDSELIYLVDDENLILEVLEELLTDAGYRVETFGNGQVLLDFIDTREPDLIISDINMPKVDGLEMSANLRDRGYEVPIIFVSAYVTKESILNGLKSNASFFIEKPYDEKNLLTVIGSVLNTARVKKALAHSMDYVLYQFANHEELLLKAGKEKELKLMKNEILNLLELNKSL